MPSFVLVDSPLVGPFTWSLVADELRSRRFAATVPALPEEPERGAIAHHFRATVRARVVTEPLPD